MIAEGTDGAREEPRAAFYCVSDRTYFLGAVAMINSLRLLGHEEQVFLLDCGLDPGQRELVADEATVVPGPGDFPAQLLKTVAPLRHGAETMVLIDADMIVTRSLTPLIDAAANGGVVAFRDRQERFFPEWGRLLGLGTARPIPYVSSGLVAAGGRDGREVLALMHELREAVDFERTFWRRNDRDYPFLYADQDVLNAILATRAPTATTSALDHRLAATPPYRGLRLVDSAAIRCAYRDGTEPYVVHQYVRKPWLEATYHSVYSRLFARLLLGEDVAMRVPEAQVPLRMRRGLRARAARARTNVRDFARWRFGDRVPGPIAVRLESARKRREARAAG